MIQRSALFRVDDGMVAQYRHFLYSSVVSSSALKMCLGRILWSPSRLMPRTCCRLYIARLDWRLARWMLRGGGSRLGMKAYLARYILWLLVQLPIRIDTERIES